MNITRLIDVSQQNRERFFFFLHSSPKRRLARDGAAAAPGPGLQAFKRTRCPTTPGASNTQTGGGRAASRAPHDRDRGCDGGGGGGAAAAAAAAAAAVAAVAAAAVASATGAGAAAAMTGAVGALENNPGSRSGYKPVSYFLKNDVGFADSLTESLKKKTLKKRI